MFTRQSPVTRLLILNWIERQTLAMNWLKRKRCQTMLLLFFFFLQLPTKWLVFQAQWMHVKLRPWSTFRAGWQATGKRRFIAHCPTNRSFLRLPLCIRLTVWFLAQACQTTIAHYLLSFSIKMACVKKAAFDDNQFNECLNAWKVYKLNKKRDEIYCPPQLWVVARPSLMIFAPITLLNRDSIWCNASNSKSFFHKWKPKAKLRL